MFKSGQQVYFIDYSEGPVPVPEIVTIVCDSYNGYYVELSNGYKVTSQPNQLFTSYKKCLEAAIVSATYRVDHYQRELKDNLESLAALKALYEKEKDV